MNKKPLSLSQAHYQLSEAMTLLMELFNGDKPKCEEWLHSEQDILFNQVPAHLILIGEGRAIIDYLEERAGKKAQLSTYWDSIKKETQRIGKFMIPAPRELKEAARDILKRSARKVEKVAPVGKKKPRQP